MSSITFTNKLGTRFPAKIKERHPFRSIFRKRHVTSLFTIIPDRIAICNMRTQQTSTCHGKSIIFGYTSVIRSIEQFFRSSKPSIAILHLPSTPGLKCRRIFVIPGIGHINYCCIPIFQDTPSRDGGVTFYVKFEWFCRGQWKRTNIDTWFSRYTFHTRTIRHKTPIGRNIGMIRIDGIRKFYNRQNSIHIINISQISRHIVAEN